MILHGDRSEIEDLEPVLRSCWECNSAHEYLKKVNMLHICHSCGRMWVFGLFMDEVGSPEKMLEICAERYGMKPGDSTTTVDAGHRVRCIEVGPAPEGDVLEP